MQILGIGHRRNVGKDTFADLLITHLRINCQKYPQRRGFADKIKDVAYQLYAWAGHQPPEYYDKHRDKRENVLIAIEKSPREIWIELGNKLREIYSDTWISYLIQKDICDILIITDVRYLNEVEAIKSKDGKIIKIDRPGIEQYDDIADSALANFDGWDKVITNDGSLNDLNKKMLEVVKEFGYGC